jgi:hypothetical protein
MYRVLTPFINLIAALTIAGIFQNGVTLNISAPAEVTAGTEFEVTVNIQKGDLESFSRLQQTLPAGLTASSYISSDADFTFEEKRVRFIWLRMPQKDNFNVTYKVKVDKRLKGTFSIDSKFSYIDQNERKSVNFVSESIAILPSTDIDPSLIVDIAEFEDKVVPYISPATAEPQMLCVRQTPIPDPSGEGYVVKLLVNKEAKQKFAKIEEIIPAGYKAVNLEPRESIFTFKGNIAKFLWMNLPSDPFFLVSYKLIPDGRKTEQPFLNGKFSYLEGEKTISIDIRQTDMDLASIQPEQIGNLTYTSEPAPLAENITEKTKEPDAIKQKDVVAVEKTIPERKKPKSQAKTPKNGKDYLLEPETGIYYRVQLAAGHNNVDIRKYFRKYNLDKEVRKEEHEGWQKYSIGSFSVYKDARDYRVHIWNTTIIDDAFVSAYNNGARITVQEALMIANQQWYK